MAGVRIMPGSFNYTTVFVLYADTSKFGPQDARSRPKRRRTRPDRRQSGGPGAGSPGRPGRIKKTSRYTCIPVLLGPVSFGALQGRSRPREDKTSTTSRDNHKPHRLATYLVIPPQATGASRQTDGVAPSVCEGGPATYLAIPPPRKRRGHTHFLFWGGICRNTTRRVIADVPACT